ncbi:MAG: hypothetical protein WBA57_12380 [Elainellaceae cyanobacterium]
MDRVRACREAIEGDIVQTSSAGCGRLFCEPTMALLRPPAFRLGLRQLRGGGRIGYR